MNTENAAKLPAGIFLLMTFGILLPPRKSRYGFMKSKKQFHNQKEASSDAFSFLAQNDMTLLYQQYIFRNILLLRKIIAQLAVKITSPDKSAKK